MLWIFLAVCAAFGTRLGVECRQVKRSVPSFEIEGCFSKFDAMVTRRMPVNSNSNVGCQQLCRGQGYALAATHNQNYCKCGNIYPTGYKVADSECNSSCRTWHPSPCTDPQSCCGGSKGYTVSLVGNIDVPKQILRRICYLWQTNAGYRTNVMKKFFDLWGWRYQAGLERLFQPLQFAVKATHTDGRLKTCTMKANDRSANSDTYSCQTVSDISNKAVLKALQFNIEDRTPLNVAKPEPIKGFRPAVCSPSGTPYQCKKRLATSVQNTKGLKIGTGFTMGVSVGFGITTKASVNAGFVNAETSTSFNTEISASTSLNVERSSVRRTTTQETTEVTVDVPKNSQVRINMLRTVEDLEYRWKATFAALGYFTMKLGSFVVHDDISTALVGELRNFYAFGFWRYPGQDVIKIVVTSQFGEKKGCDHQTGQGSICNMTAASGK